MIFFFFFMLQSVWKKWTTREFIFHDKKFFMIKRVLFWTNGRCIKKFFHRRHGCPPVFVIAWICPWTIFFFFKYIFSESGCWGTTAVGIYYRPRSLQIRMIISDGLGIYWNWSTRSMKNAQLVARTDRHTLM